MVILSVLDHTSFYTEGVLISWVLPALDAGYHLVSWLNLNWDWKFGTYFNLLAGIGALETGETRERLVFSWQL